MTERLLGKPVADAVEGDIRTAIRAGRSQGRRVPQLVSIHRGVPSPFAAYLGRQRKAAERLGIGFRDIALPLGAEAADLLQTIRAADSSSEVDGVLVEHPLPSPLDFPGALAALRPEKDIDGVGEANLGRLIEGHPTRAPAVALAALAILDHYGVPLARSRTAVIGRSATVGLPLAILLASKQPRRDATVTIAHSQTPDLRAALEGCSVIVSCAGKPGLLTRRVVPKDAVVIDVGLSTPPPDPTGVHTGVVGDAVAAEMEGWARSYSPVPGGVGPVTVAELMANTVAAWRDSSAGGAR